MQENEVITTVIGLMDDLAAKQKESTLIIKKMMSLLLWTGNR